MVQEPTLDAPLSKSQRDEVDSLLKKDLGSIDRDILTHCSSNWQKVAKICGSVMSDSKYCSYKIPDIYIAQRIYDLIRSGNLEYQGHLGAMRFCEVKISTNNDHSRNISEDSR